MRCFSEAIETMSRKELERLQFRKLKSLLDAVYQKNLFYREKFDTVGLKPERIRHFDDFRKLVPFSDKKEFIKDQENFPVYGRRIGVPLPEVVEFHLSSGTSGIGQEIHAFTHADVELSGTSWAYHFVWAGIERGDTVSITVPVSITGAPFSAMAGLRKLGCKPFMIGTLDGQKRLEIVHRFESNYLSSSPVYLTRMTATLKEMNLDPREYFPKLKVINLSSGSYPLEWARKMEEIWGTRLSEFYAGSAAGAIIAPSCERGVFDSEGKNRGYLHLLENHHLIEVLDPETLQPVKSGEEGELVITTLDKVASPVVRFRTADKVRFFTHGSCECGRPFNLIECGSIARFDDMIKIKRMNIWPQTVDEVVFGYPEIEEYNADVIIDEKSREVVKVLVEFKMEVSEKRKGELLDILAFQLRQKTGIHMQTLEGKQGEVQHFERKAKRFRDKRQESLTKHVM